MHIFFTLISAIKFAITMCVTTTPANNSIKNAQVYYFWRNKRSAFTAPSAIDFCYAGIFIKVEIDRIKLGQLCRMGSQEIV